MTGFAEAAVLDIELGDELVFPIADELTAKGVPVVFYTGYDVNALPERFADVRVVSKAADPGKVVQALQQIGPESPLPKMQT